MPSGPSDIGIDDTALLLVEQLEVGVDLEERIIKNTDGTFADGQLIDPIYSFSVKGRGASPKDVGAVASGITSLTGGKTIINKVKDSEKNDDYQSFEFSGQNFPSA